MQHKVGIVGVLVGGCLALWGLGLSTAWSSTAMPSLQEQGDALIKNVEDMVAHGGMGDGKAIIHHCAEAARLAGHMVQQVGTAAAPEDARRALDEVILQCRRVADRGPQSDPGLLLNPAIKVRTAARQSMKAMGLHIPN